MSSKKVVRTMAFIILGIGVRALSNVILLRLGFTFLGEKTFGLWVLLQSLVMYLNLSDLGVGQSIMNLQGVQAETRDWPAASRVLSSGVFIFSLIALTMWLVTNGIVRFFPGLWSSTDLSIQEFQFYFVSLSTLAFLVLPLSAFSASLGGLRDLDIRSFWELGLILLMGVATATALVTRQSLLVVLTAPLMAQLLWYLIPPLVLRVRHPEVKFRPSFVERGVIRTLVSSSAFIFLMSLALLTQRYAGNFIAGLTISMEAVARIHPHMILFQIFGWALTDAVTRALLPYVTGMGVRKDWEKIHFVCRIAAKMTMLVAVGFSAFMWLAAQPILGIWLSQGVFLGDRVLLLLIIAFILDSGAMVFTNFSIAMDRHRRRAVWLVLYAFSFAGGGAVGTVLAPPEHAILGLVSGFLSVTLIYQLGVFPVLNQRDLGFSARIFFRDVLARVAVFAALLIGALTALKSVEMHWILRLGIGGLVIGGATALFACKGLFNVQERDWLAARLKLPFPFPFPFSLLISRRGR